MAGFLPPITKTGGEIGWVEFSVTPKSGVPPGTRIANQAFVEFDVAGDLYDHPAPKEGPWINTIADPNDIAPNGRIDFWDIAKLGDRWLWEGSPGGIDADVFQDGVVNFRDYCKLAESWMK